MNSSEPALGSLFAKRYRIAGAVGRGATAIVYRAIDESSGDAVAVKAFRPELTDATGAERFVREIRLNLRMAHPGILPVLDSGTADGLLFFVMPLMEGTLRERLARERQFPLHDAVGIARDVAQALAHAHTHRLVHRDVKPENILFRDGVTYLGDFGIARALEHAIGESTTSTGVVRGTPAYMSPEQAAGEHTYDGRSDIFSLGCVLYEMVGGVPAFVGPSAQSIIAQRLTYSPTPVTHYRDGLPASLAEAIATSLAIAPADRFQHAADLVGALDRVAADLDNPQAPRAPRAADAVRIGARRVRRRLAAGALVTTMAVAFALAAWSSRVATPTDATAESDPRRIAVLYLDNQTPAELPMPVADGVTEDLIDQLGDVRALHVISPTGVRPLRGRSLAPDSVGRLLKIGTIISGSIARSGQLVRINVRLVDARTGQQLYSSTLTEPWTELFALQDKLAEQVAFVLRQRLGDEIAVRQLRAGTRSVAAWEALQMASAATRNAIEGATLRNDASALQLFLRADSLNQHAAALDPRWTLPLVHRGRLALNALAASSPLPPDGQDATAYARLGLPARRVLWSQSALQLANAALRIDANAPDALALRGQARVALVNLGADNRDSLAALAERDLRAAIDRRPDLAVAWSALAELQSAQGRFAEGAVSAQRAFESDAFFEQRRVLSVAYSLALSAQRFDDARHFCRLGLTHYAGDPRFTECELRLAGWTASTRTDVESAWQTLTRIEHGDTHHLLDATWGFRRLMVAAVAARSGMADSARAILNAVIARQPPDARPSSLLAEAYVRLLLGDRAGALDRLADQASTMPESRGALASHPWFESLRGEPRFESMVRAPR